VRRTVQGLGGEANLQAVYASLERNVPSNWLTPTWKAKVRQQLQLDPCMCSIERGVWKFEKNS
jgi:hypothetical protein